MPIERVFLDWNAAPLAAFARWFERRSVSSASLIVVPNGYAVDCVRHIVGKDGPDVVALGELDRRLWPQAEHSVGRLVRQQLWTAALDAVSAASLRKVFPELPGNDRPIERAGVGAMLERLHLEIDDASLDDLVVAEATEPLASENEAQRWHVLAEIHAEFRRLLAQAAAEAPPAVLTEELICFGVVEWPNRLQRKLREESRLKTTIVVVAPQSLQQAFDDLGAVVPAEWSDYRLPLKLEQVEVAANPAAQAQSAATAAAGAPAGKLVIAVAESEVDPHLRHAFLRAKLPAIRCPQPLSRSGPWQLLSAVADHLDEGSFGTFATLVRHPDLSQHLDQVLAGGPTEASRTSLANLIPQLDQYGADHLPDRPPRFWLGEEGVTSGMRRLQYVVERMLKEFDDRSRTLNEWAEAVAALLRTVFSGAESREVGWLLGSLGEFRKIDGGWSRRLVAVDALRLLLDAWSGEKLEPPRDDGVRRCSWTDVFFETAEEVLVLGFNEGRLPKNHGGDLFLPNSLRARLGMLDNEKCYAADCYRLASLLASRQRVRLIAGRRTNDGDPLLPSRLMFACEKDDLPKRVRAFFDPARTTPDLLTTDAPADLAFTLPPPPRPLAVPVEKIRVTAFRDYLSCPYRFYLRHVLKLRRAETLEDELDAGRFGSLAHDVLEHLKDPEIAACSEERKVALFLSDKLDEIVERKYGRNPLPAIAIQREQLRLRLFRFAKWQAGWAERGWRVIETEFEVDEADRRFDVDGADCQLNARIDRLDFNERTGDWCVLDYKTSDAGKSPREYHGPKDGKWKDLQLPLYSHLLRKRAPGRLHMGYILFVKSLEAIDLSLADWSPIEVQDGVDTARRVLRDVRAEKFWPPTRPAPEFFDEFAALCRDEIRAIEREEAEP